MQTHEVIENCVDKGKSAVIWEKKGIKIPKTFDIHTPEDLKRAFDVLGDNDGLELMLVEEEEVLYQLMITKKWI